MAFLWSVKYVLRPSSCCVLLALGARCMRFIVMCEDAAAKKVACVYGLGSEEGEEGALVLSDQETRLIALSLCLHSGGRSFCTCGVGRVLNRTQTQSLLDGDAGWQ